MGVRFTDAERDEIEAVADALGVSAGALIRAGALGAARTGPALLAQEAVAVHVAAGALASVGRNLNQIARALNGGDDVDAADFDVTLEAIRERVALLGEAHRSLLVVHARRGDRVRRALTVGGDAPSTKIRS